MPSFLPPLIGELAWPLAVALAWIVGEIGHRITSLPRISLYGLVGFALGSAQLGWLPQAASGTTMLLANIAFGLILFEFGYRVNLRWLRINPWIGITGVVEAAATFALVYFCAIAFGTSVLTALLIASLSMSTSPAAIMRVVNEERSSGQLTERLFHLTAVNCVLAVFIFKVVVGFWIFQTSGSVWQAVSNSLIDLAASSAIGAAFGVALPVLLRRMGRLTHDATVGFAIGVILAVAIAQAFKISPVLAALTFGFVARHRRVVMNRAQRGFGALGDLLVVLLFVFVATTIEWHRVWLGFGLALALIAIRLVTKVTVVAGFAYVSGVSWRKGALTGLAMTPISVFAILLLEQTRYVGVDLVDLLAPLAAATLLLELVGPVVTQRALMLAGESAEAAPRS
jgi:Kef-type K+ transport system membrane component KefB